MEIIVKSFKEQKMKIAAVIAEYNPLQNGHLYHLSRAVKDAGADKVVCIMSGNFTQRGELAIADKYTRAEWAVKCGADTVVELPPQYVLTAAKYFALGGVKIANAIKGDITLSFGSEIGRLNALKEVAHFEENGEFKTALDEELKKGNGYAKSYYVALEKTQPFFARLLELPNNILAVEYLKSLKQTQSSVIPHTLTRIGGGYLDTQSTDYPSSSCVREQWQNGNLSAIAQGVPNIVLDYLNNTSPSIMQTAKDKLMSILKFNIDNIPLQNIHGVKEGVENRVKTALKESSSWQELIDKLSTKRYTNAYLLRTLINMLISNTYSANDLQNDNIHFVNVLAVEEKSKELLSCFDCNVITKSVELPDDCLIKRTDNLYSSVTKKMPNHMQIVRR